MRDPNNLIDVYVPETRENFSVIKLENIPKFDKKAWDLLDDKQFDKYVKHVKIICRSSREYKKLIKFLRENMEMNKCTFYENINNIETTKIKIHIHHDPFTLTDIILMVFNKRCARRENLHAEAVAEEVMMLHYQLLIGLIPLSETVHELVHNGFLFIPADRVMGNFMRFKELYDDYMTPEQRDIYGRIMLATKNYRQDLSMLEQHYVYLDTSGEYQLPKLSDIVDMLHCTIDDIKQQRNSDYMIQQTHNYNNREQPLQQAVTFFKKED